MSTTVEALSIPTNAAALVQHPSPLTFLYSNLTSILSEPIIGLIQEYYVDPKELGEKFACCRSANGAAERYGRGGSDCDQESVRALTSTRTAQREELITELKPKNVQRLAA